MAEVRKAVKADIVAVDKIYDDILTEEENGRAHIGWVRGVYPTRATAEEALRAGELFVMTEDTGHKEVVAAARINQVQVPEYAGAQWEHTEALPEQIMVLHTLVVSPGCAGKGYGTAFVKFYEEYAKKQGCPYLRMDTNAKNKAARRLYRHLGFAEAGIVPCQFNGIPDIELVCLEKTV